MQDFASRPYDDDFAARDAGQYERPYRGRHARSDDDGSQVGESDSERHDRAARHRRAD